MTEEKSLFDLLEEAEEEEEEIEEEVKEKLKKAEIKRPKTPRAPRVPKLTAEKAEELIKEAIDQDYKKILLIKEILQYTKTEKALHTCGEILKGKSLPRTNKKTLANEVKRLINEKILQLT